MSGLSENEGRTAEDKQDGTRLDISIGDGTWGDLAGPIELIGRITRATLLPGGTRDGNPTVEILVRLNDGRLVHANTTWHLWAGATEVFHRYNEQGGD